MMTNGSGGKTKLQCPLLSGRKRLGQAVALFLLFAPGAARADERGQALVARVLERITALQPAVCDYTVTYRVADASLTSKHHATLSGSNTSHSGSSGTRSGPQAILPSEVDNALFNTLEFLPCAVNPFAPQSPPLTANARYVGSEMFEGVEYEVVEVTTPLRRFIAEPPSHTIALRWYVGADSLVHRITARLPLTDIVNLLPGTPVPPAKPPLAAGKKAVREVVRPSAPSGKSPASGGDKPAPVGAVPPPAASAAVILVEAVSAGARKAVLPLMRPPTNPPLPPRIHLEPGAWNRVASLSPDGRLLAAALNDNSIVLYDVVTGEKTFQLTGHGAQVTRLAFAGDSHLLASVDNTDAIVLWDAGTGTQRRQIKGTTATIRGLSLSANGAALAVVTGAAEADIWNTETGAKIRTLSVPNVQAATLSPDGTRLIATGYFENDLWDVANGQSCLRLPYVGGPFPSLPAAWSPDGKVYVWMRSDGGLRVCDGRTGAQICELSGTAGIPQALAFASDGKTLLAVDTDQRGDIPTGKPGLVIWKVGDWSVAEARELTGTRTNGVQTRPILAPVGRRLLLMDNEGLQFWDLAETLPPVGTKADANAGQTKMK